MGYQLRKHEPYVITGKKGQEYKIPAAIDMNLDAMEISLKFNDSTDGIERAKLCKEFFLLVAPELEKEGISDMEYFVIFQDYNKTSIINRKGELGES